jgi:hypothetical protein
LDQESNQRGGGYPSKAVAAELIGANLDGEFHVTGGRQTNGYTIH